MTQDLTSLRIDELAASRMAIFLDFDGTLVEIADKPHLVRLAPEVRSALTRISGAVGGALALVSGRSLDDIDAYLAPLVLPAAGVHGQERRNAKGRCHNKPVDTEALDLLGRRLAPFVAERQGLLIENKPGSLALHYRQRPELEEACFDAVGEAASGLSAITLMRGKMVIEAKAGGAHKGEAVADFMNEAPFAGRIPLYAGDDTTDEDAFAEVNARGGISIKVGPGETAARFRTEDVAAFHAWLEQLAAHFDAAGDAVRDKR